MFTLALTDFSGAYPQTYLSISAWEAVHVIIVKLFLVSKNGHDYETGFYYRLLVNDNY